MSPSASLVVALLNDRPRSRFLAVVEPSGESDPTPSCAGNCDLCSADFVSGPGWAWRVTAALSRARRADAAVRERRSA